MFGVSDSNELRQQLVSVFDPDNPDTVLDVVPIYSVGTKSGDRGVGSYNTTRRIWKGAFPAQPDEGEYSDFVRDSTNNDVFQIFHHSDDPENQNYWGKNHYAYRDTETRRAKEIRHPTAPENSDSDPDNDIVISMNWRSHDPEFMKNGRILSRADYFGNTTTYQYNDSVTHKMTEIIDSEGVTAYTWDPTHWQIKTESFPDARTVTYNYDSATYELTSIVDNLNGTTTYEYYADRKLKKITHPNGRELTYQYDNLGQVTSVTSNWDPPVTYTYTGSQLDQVTVGNDTTLYTYDAWGRNDSITQKGVTTSRVYDGWNRVVKVVDALNNTTTYEYDAWGQQTQVTDPKQNTTQNVWNSAGDLIQVIDAENGVTRYQYDESGNFQSFTDPEDNATTYVYDLSRRNIGSFTKKGPTYYQDINLYDTTQCSSCGGENNIDKSYHYTGDGVAPWTNDWITWKDYTYSAGRLVRVDFYETMLYDPATFGVNLGTLNRSLTYEYNHVVNGANSGLVTRVTDDALPFVDQDYVFEYNSDLQLTKITHPQGYFEEFWYDSRGRLEARRDIDGGIYEYTYDSEGRMDQIQDPWNHVTQYVYNTSTDPGPLGALKEILHANGTQAQYTYDTLHRLGALINRASDNTVMSSFDYTYDANGNITRIDLADNDAWVYGYDNLNRLTREAKHDPADALRWYREYDYDGVGNREEMRWFNGSVTETTNYSYNTLNQLTQLTDPTGTTDFSYDSQGNQTLKDPPETGDTWNYEWTLDKRLKEVDSNETGLITEYAYDYKGARILRRDDDGTRSRYFFKGVTEEVIKKSVAEAPGGHSDEAFTFVTMDDGDSTAQWHVYDNTPSGSSMSVVYDTDRRSDVLHFQGSPVDPYADPPVWGNGWILGEGQATWSQNPNDTPWNDTTHRVLSFWMKSSEPSVIYVIVNTNAGERYLTYVLGAGIDYRSCDYMRVYLGDTLVDGDWRRFERNLVEDLAYLDPGVTFSSVGGLFVRASNLRLDDITLTNAVTVEQNSLSPGARITSAAKRENHGGDGTTGITKSWPHFNHIGNIQCFSNEEGMKTLALESDAWGNRIGDTTTGASISVDGARSITSKKYDADVEFYYFYQRWVNPETGRFTNQDFIQSRYDSNLYEFCESRPINISDATGLWAADPKKWGGAINTCKNNKSCKVTDTDANCCSFVQCVFDNYNKNGGDWVGPLPPYPYVERPNTFIPPYPGLYPPGVIVSDTPGFTSKCLGGSRSQDPVIGGGHIYITDENGKICECLNIFKKSFSKPKIHCGKSSKASNKPPLEVW